MEATAWPPLLALAFVARLEPDDGHADSGTSGSPAGPAATSAGIGAAWGVVWASGLGACSLGGGGFGGDMGTDGSDAAGAAPSADMSVDAPPEALRPLVPFLVRLALHFPVKQCLWHPAC